MKLVIKTAYSILIATIILVHSSSTMATESALDSVLNYKSTPLGVFGGEETHKTDSLSQHMVNVVSASHCSGVLVSNNIVLTAASCFDKSNGQNKILFGQDIEFPATSRNIKKVYIHPKYQAYGRGISSEDVDLALVEFHGRLPRGFRPVKIASTLELKNSQQATVAGYGYGKNVRNVNSSVSYSNRHGRLRYTNLILLKKSDISEREQPKHDNFILLLQKGLSKGVTFGDSGGGAFIQSQRGRLKLAGIASWSQASTVYTSCRRENLSCYNHAGYVRLPKFTDWINQHPGMKFDINNEKPYRWNYSDKQPANTGSNPDLPDDFGLPTEYIALPMASVKNSMGHRLSLVCSKDKQIKIRVDVPDSQKFEEIIELLREGNPLTATLHAGNYMKAIPIQTSWSINAPNSLHSNAAVDSILHTLRKHNFASFDFSIFESSLKEKTVFSLKGSSRAIRKLQKACEI